MKKYNYTHAQLQQRAHEDRFIENQELFPGVILFAILDGHGNGDKNNIDRNHIVDYCIENLPKNLIYFLSKVDLKNRDLVKLNIKAAFFLTDDNAYKNGKIHGAVCSVTLIDLNNNIMYNANLGDSKTILASNINGNYNVIFESSDHMPIDSSEKDRILISGYEVVKQRLVTDSASYAMSRAFGDFDGKILKNEIDSESSAMTSIPCVTSFELDKNNYFILMSSDGLFESSNITTGSIFAHINADRNYMGNVCKNLISLCVNNQVTDDITIMGINLF
jgi:serine/threonine protein phosphatase PrpC